MNIRTFIEGFYFSLPAALLIYFGFAFGNESIGWYLWSIALVIGLPANILLSVAFIAVSVMGMSLAGPGRNHPVQLPGNPPLQHACSRSGRTPPQRCFSVAETARGTGLFQTASSSRCRRLNRR